MKHIKEILTLAQIEELAAMLKSSNRATRILNNPEKVNEFDLDRLAEITGVHQYLLMNEYGVGLETIPAICMLRYREQFETENEIV